MGVTLQQMNFYVHVTHKKLFLNNERKQERLLWAREWRNWNNFDWRKKIFVDEMKLTIGKEEADPWSDIHLELFLRIALLSLPFLMIRLRSCLLLVSPTVSTLSLCLPAKRLRECGRVLEIGKHEFSPILSGDLYLILPSFI